VSTGRANRGAGLSPKANNMLTIAAPRHCAFNASIIGTRALCWSLKWAKMTGRTLRLPTVWQRLIDRCVELVILCGDIMSVAQPNWSPNATLKEYPGARDHLDLRTNWTKADVFVNDDVKNFLKLLVPLGRLGTADEVAKAALFLASDDSSFVIGIELFVDGGSAAIWIAAIPGGAATPEST